MLLAIDAGNTNITFGAYDGDRLAADWRVSADGRRTSDEYAVLVAGLAEGASISLSQLTSVSICSVIPRAIEPLLAFSRKYLKIQDPFLLTPELDLGIRICYEPRTDVGADRLANAIAAHALYPGPVIVVDLGTATTFDAIAENGDYLGGAIAPGIEVSLEALISKAAQLRRVRLVTPPRAIGTTTVSSVQSGMIYGFAGQVDGVVGRLQEEMGGDAYVVATGGLAELIAPHSRSIRTVNPTLTLEGLRLAYERYRGKG
ncbi:MAG: type III pantothenate kinase [Armatimonadota bacterium]|nr:type III pantothenate kinase [Armatimonadota bacterium]